MNGQTLKDTGISRVEAKSSWASWDAPRLRGRWALLKRQATQLPFMAILLGVLCIAFAPLFVRLSELEPAATYWYSRRARPCWPGCSWVRPFFSWYDLTLYLIARLLGTEEAMHVARLYLLDWHYVGQQPFATLTRSRQVDDAFIARCQEWIAQHYDQDAPVAAMARLSDLAERSFKRRFVRVTGMLPMQYVHTLRLEESKHLLETTELPIEAVANEVGYEDASFFGRLFRRQVGLTPAQYRKRFGALRKALQAGVASIDH